MEIIQVHYHGYVTLFVNGVYITEVYETGSDRHMFDAMLHGFSNVLNESIVDVTITNDDIAKSGVRRYPEKYGESLTTALDDEVALASEADTKLEAARVVAATKGLIKR